MTSITSLTGPDAASPWTPARGRDASATPGGTAETQTPSPQAQTGEGLLPTLSSGMQSVLIQDQSSAAAPVSPESAAMIVAADILAQDIVRGADTNHNGSLSYSEVAAVSPTAAQNFGALGGNNVTGQLTAGALASDLLQGQSVFSA